MAEPRNNNAMATTALTLVTAAPSCRGHQVRETEQQQRLQVGPPQVSPLSATASKGGARLAPALRSPRSSIYYYSDTLRRGSADPRPAVLRQDTDSGVSSSSWASSWHHNNSSGSWHNNSSGESTPRGLGRDNGATVSSDHRFLAKSPLAASSSGAASAESGMRRPIGVVKEEEGVHQVRTQVTDGRHAGPRVHV